MSDNVKETPVQETPVVEEETVMQEEAPKQEEKKGFLKKDKKDKSKEQIAALEKKVEELEAKAAKDKDDYIRLMAEFDNYRKRVIKEKADLIMNGGEKVLTAILPVMDDMERALEQMQKAENVQAVVEGVQLIQKKFMGILEKQGVKPIETKDADFDVELHEAIAQFPAPSEDLKNKVVDCTLKGYKLNEKVIRHAQVVVGI